MSRFRQDWDRFISDQQVEPDPDSDLSSFDQVRYRLICLDQARYRFIWLDQVHLFEQSIQPVVLDLSADYVNFQILSGFRLALKKIDYLKDIMKQAKRGVQPPRKYICI
jgi:hypothetical protein